MVTTIKNITPLARLLRKQLTPAERKLWYSLRRRQMAGLRFQRQVPLGNYIVDFLCYEANLIIEIDGSQHAENTTQIYDDARTAWLTKQGYIVKRYWNNEIMGQYENVLEDIRNSCLHNIGVSMQGKKGNF